MNCIEITSEKQLLQTGLFPNQKKLRWYLLLHFIDKRGEPAGCWALREDLFTVGMDCSTATIGRYLKELDYQDYTVQNSNLGRVVTPSGKAYLRDMDERLERALMQSELSRNVKVTTFDELSDLLIARRALEAKAAGLAARHADEAGLKRLCRSLEAHQATVQHNDDPTEPALDFHTVVAEISGNRFILSVLNMLIYEERRMEAKMETLVTRERGRIYVKEHEEIAAAICAHDARRAEELMDRHIAVLCAAVEEQRNEN